jgi:hypothetical protein
MAKHRQDDLEHRASYLILTCFRIIVGRYASKDERLTRSIIIVEMQIVLGVLVDAVHKHRLMVKGEG